MPNAEINILAVFAAAIINVIIGFVWYSPAVFGHQWLALIGKSEKDLDEMKKSASKAYTLSFLGSLIMSYVLSLFIYYTQATNLFEGLKTGFWLWLGFIAVVFFNSYLFAKKPAKLCLIDGGYYLVSLLSMSVFLAVVS